MSDFTPGPWRAENRDWKGQPSTHNIYISGDFREDYGDEEDEDSEPTSCATGIAIVHGNATSGGVTEANARLIAAAPDLLKCLEDVVAAFHDHPDRNESSLALARLAIAKAAGLSCTESH